MSWVVCDCLQCMCCQIDEDICYCFAYFACVFITFTTLNSLVKVKNSPTHKSSLNHLKNPLQSPYIFFLLLCIDYFFLSAQIYIDNICECKCGKVFYDLSFCFATGNYSNQIRVSSTEFRAISQSHCHPLTPITLCLAIILRYDGPSSSTKQKFVWEEAWLLAAYPSWCFLSSNSL